MKHKTLQKKLSHKKKLALRNKIEVEPKWDSDSDVEDSNNDKEDYCYDIYDVNNLEVWEKNYIEINGSFALRKYKIMSQYNIGELSIPFLKAIDNNNKKHLNLKKISIVSGIGDPNECMKKLDFYKPEVIPPEILYNPPVLRNRCLCIYGIIILRIIGCIDFLEALPLRLLKNDFKHQLQNYLEENKNNLESLVEKSEDMNIIQYASKILYTAFGIKIKTSDGNLYLKSIWIWDRVYKRILPKLSNVANTKLLPLYIATLKNSVLMDIVL